MSSSAADDLPVGQPDEVPQHIRLRGVVKTFAGTQALNGVDLDIRPGEIHALCGGNGSGKSTLIKILSGVYQADEGGTISVGEKTVPAHEMTPLSATELGVRTVHQDLAVFPDLTVAENFGFGVGFQTARFGRIAWRKQRALAQELISEFEIDASPNTLLRKLTLAQRAQVAIARALRAGEGKPRLLILDEPTAALPIREVKQLLASLRRLAAAGQAILYVSHRLDEVLALSDSISVLRDGALVETRAAADYTESTLVEAMLGRSIEAALPRESHAVGTDAVVRISGLNCGPLTDLDLSVYPGEIVGVAGLNGSGRSRLLRTLFGLERPDSGEIHISGKPVKFSRPSQAMAQGIAMVPENRISDANFPGLSIEENMTVTVMGRYFRRLRMATPAARTAATELSDAFKVKTTSVRAPMTSLSGGNQQKVIMARWMQRTPSLLLLDEPTQGVDAGARADIYALVRDATANGAAAIVVASDFEELAQVADRVLVMRRGRIIAELAGDRITAHTLTELSMSEGNVRS
ncbi:sugar ABC transporter ATP-binding protein [Rhodococcoides yunnanense]|uniref:sugar ABC transporter ATP-binding protein n=1 Tax=Rhodococcoides yunnanense TaxID=278209 RepID=UPI000933F51D|nr:sugar ABC transporter ATP-binding protein [Rhodococcus yunnanensis]